MSKRLQKYLEYKSTNKWGWINTYEETVSDNWATLTGHYEGMLSELIDMIGIDKVKRLVAIHSEINEDINEKL